MKKQELIELIEKAKQIGIGLSCFKNAEDHFNQITIDEKGDFEIQFSQWHHGDFDYDTILITFEDLSESIEDVVSKYKAIKAEMLEKEKQNRELEEKKQAELKLIEKENRDKMEYERLSKKFNP